MLAIADVAAAATAAAYAGSSNVSSTVSATVAFIGSAKRRIANGEDFAIFARQTPQRPRFVAGGRRQVAADSDWKRGKRVTATRIYATLADV